MQMIDVLKRLAELDAANPNRPEFKIQTLQNINVNEDVKVDECGMMGSMDRPSTPASINMTAASGEELSGMLKDIMTLAGTAQSHNEPIAGNDGMAVVDVDSDMDEPSLMRKTLDKLNPKLDGDEETEEGIKAAAGGAIAGGMAAGPLGALAGGLIGSDLEEVDQTEEKVDELANTPADPTEYNMGNDAEIDRAKHSDLGGSVGAGDDRQLHSNPIGKPMSPEATYESLMADYRKFLGEEQEVETLKEYYSVHVHDSNGRPKIIGMPTKFAGSAISTALKHLESGNAVTVRSKDYKGQVDSVTLNPGDRVKDAVLNLRTKRDNDGEQIMPAQQAAEKNKTQDVAEDDLDEDPITGALIGGALGIAAGVKGAHHANKNTNPNNGFKGYAKNFARGIVDPQTYKKKKEEGVAEGQPVIDDLQALAQQYAELMKPGEEVDPYELEELIGVMKVNPNFKNMVMNRVKFKDSSKQAPGQEYRPPTFEQGMAEADTMESILKLAGLKK